MIDAEISVSLSPPSVDEVGSFPRNAKERKLHHIESSSDDLAQPASIVLPEASDKEGIISASFLGLLITQFLGALNDNLFRWLVAWIGCDLAVQDPRMRSLVAWCLKRAPEEITSKSAADIVVPAGLAFLVLPFILFAAPAGFFADRFSKRTIIVSCKAAEVVLMLLGVDAILHGNIWLMFGILFCMGCHSAIFSPSKYGSIPEIIRPGSIPAANGLIGMTTILAIVLGCVGAGWLYEWTKPLGKTHWWVWAATLLSVALIGCVTSLPIRKLKPANPTRTFPFNLFSETLLDFKRLIAIRSLFFAALGSAFFWSLGGLCQINVDHFGTNYLQLTKDYVGPLLGMLALGVGVGNVFAGVISKGRIELALIPLGAIGLGVSHVLLFLVPAGNGTPWNFEYFMTAGCLVLLGFSGGVYDVPLQSYLQYKSPEQSRGSIFAATNFLTFVGTIGATGVYVLLGGVFKIPSQTIFLLVGVVFVPLIAIIVYSLRFDTVRFLVWAISRILYRVKVEGLENVPATGVLITPNHVSWADGILVGLACPRHPRMVVFADYFETPWLRWFGRMGRVILLHPGKKSIIESLRNAREAIKSGEIVCVFPEGGITRTGEMQEFQPGILTILKGTNAPIVPVYLDGMWGSLLSYEGGRFFWKWPCSFRRRVTIRFGKPLEQPHELRQVRDAVIAISPHQEAKYRLPSE